MSINLEELRDMTQTLTSFKCMALLAVELEQSETRRRPHQHQRGARPIKLL
ncbi:hypothetical protein SNOG_10034 [Parastagonospora nodorum SN15]|uniref:Uncharacterized protein n=1 Tax=Phaeosphaeria nodorum (strain SN15 / ATCC MYA-4574 / FGSC 10173) TaxID=321614 RepID=Q0UDY0_PHANO|nr:hypothetical protein SNOG_10034 [Parastagonospora nodorum SN15]EAT82369.1 hypothetical protein SNOG_10034 [Parastagonospora nodorum SN15]